jgi:hypothetical protein
MDHPRPFALQGLTPTTRRRSLLTVETLEDRTLLTGSVATPVALPAFNAQGVTSTTGTAGFGQTSDFYAVTLPAEGRLVTTVTNGPTTRLSLLLPTPLPDGTTLVQSDGVVGSPDEDLIDQHLPAGTYVLEVEELNTTQPAVTYTLTATYQSALPPFQTLPLTSQPFQTTAPIAVVGDWNGDGIPDLAVAESNSNHVDVYLGVGDGTFAPVQAYVLAGNRPLAIVAGNFDPSNTARSGKLDLAVCDATGQVEILTNKGDGTFTLQSVFVGGMLTDLVVGDFYGNGSGPLDIAVTSSQSTPVTFVPGNDSVFLLKNDGSGNFSLPATNAYYLGFGKYPIFLTPVDINHDGQLDLAVANAQGSVSILEGMGNGAFNATGPTVPAPSLTAGAGAACIAVADFNGDGVADLAVTNINDNTATILLGVQGTAGTPFPLPQYPAGTVNGTFAFGTAPGLLVAGDFNHDGKLDLATANDLSADVSVVLGNGDGTFQPQQRYAAITGANFGLPIESTPFALADFNGDGNLDLVTGSTVSDKISVLLGNPDGTFQPQLDFSLGNGEGQSGSDPHSAFASGMLVTADLTGDSRLDLISVNEDSQDVSVLRNIGGGQFQESGRFTVGAGPSAIIQEDFNNDGITDEAVLNSSSGDVSVLIGVGDGTFLPARDITPAVGLKADSMAAGDFNGDGRIDLAFGVFNSTVLQPGSVLIYLGVGDGSFRYQGAISIGVNGSEIHDIIVGDFNKDGKQDLALTDEAHNAVYLLLGNGAGSFLVGSPLSVPPPTHMVSGDFNGDGNLDLAFLSQGLTPGVSVLLGNGNGTFQAEQDIAVQGIPRQLLAVDLNNDGLTDLVFAGVNPVISTQGLYSVLLAQTDALGQLSFLIEGPFTTVGTAVKIVSADFNGDGTSDVAVADTTTGSKFGNVTVLLDTDLSGNWTAEQTLQIDLNENGGGVPTDVLVGKFGSKFNSLPDLAVTEGNLSDVAILLNNGTIAGNWQGFFTPTNPLGLQGNYDRFGTGGDPVAIVSADLNLDGPPDLVTVNNLTNDVTALLGADDGTFQDSGTISTPVRATPLVADFNGDGTLDAVVLSQAGDILFRAGRPQAPGTYDAPVLVNAGHPARDITLLMTAQGPRIAAIDSKGHSFSIYQRNADGTFTLDLTQTGVGLLPSRIKAANLDAGADGLADDLIVLDAFSGNVSLYYPTGVGTYQLGGGSPFTIGQGASDIGLVPGSNGAPDVVFSNQVGGSVAVLHNDGTGSFDFDPIFRADNDVYGLGTSSNVVSLDRTAGVASADFNNDGIPDVVAINPGANTLGVLLGRDTTNNVGHGTYYNPIVTQLGFSPTAVVVGDFNHDGNMDIAALDAQHGTVYSFLGDGTGHFTLKQVLAAGNAPTGLTVADVSGPSGVPDGILDLLVGNAQGDLLVLIGLGDGTFRELLPSDLGQAVRFVTHDFTGTGSQDAFVASQAQNVTSIQLFQPGSSTLVVQPGSIQDQNNGLLAPGRVYLQDLNGDGVLDRVVVNSGANSVVVYLSQSNGTFKQEIFPVGTNPMAAAFFDFNNDGVLDLAVANQGSNDVSILFGQGSGDNWMAVNGPRLKAGLGPIDVAVKDLVGGPTGGPDGIPDLVVTDGQGGTMTIIPGIGSNGSGTGFFNDNSPTVLTFIAPPGTSGPPPIQQIDPTNGFALTTSGALIRFNLNSIGNPNLFGQVVFTGGSGGVATSFDVTTIPSQAAPVVFLGTNQGAFELLDADSSGQYQEVGSPFFDPNATLTDISQVQIISESDNEFELYATNAGENRVFVVDFINGVPVLPPPGLPNPPIDLGNPDFANNFGTLTEANPGAVATVATLSVIEIIGRDGPDLAAGEGIVAEGSSTAMSGVLLAANSVLDATGLVESGDVVTDAADEFGVPDTALEDFVTGINQRLAQSMPGAEETGSGGMSLDQLRAALDTLFVPETAVGQVVTTTRDSIAQFGSELLHASLAATQPVAVGSGASGTERGFGLADLVQITSTTLSDTVRPTRRVLGRIAGDNSSLKTPQPSQPPLPLMPLPQLSIPPDDMSRRPGTVPRETVAIASAAVPAAEQEFCSRSLAVAIFFANMWRSRSNEDPFKLDKWRTSRTGVRDRPVL